jgi:ATPases of the AAA+ class
VPVRGKESGSGASFTERVISQFLAEMSGIEELKGVVVLATTNRLDLVDPSLLSGGRFDLILELPRPDAQAREKIFEIHLRKKPLSSEVRIATLARLTDGRTGGDIAFVCRKAAMLAVRDHLKTEETGSSSWNGTTSNQPSGNSRSFLLSAGRTREPNRKKEGAPCYSCGAPVLFPSVVKQKRGFIIFVLRIRAIG